MPYPLSPQVLVEGHEDDIYHVETHNKDSALFVTCCASGRVRVWDTQKRDVLRSAAIGFAVAGIAVSDEVTACLTCFRGESGLFIDAARGGCC